MPTVRVDDEVYRWLQSLATPFEDNPNSVLRKVAGLSEGTGKPSIIDSKRGENGMGPVNHSAEQRLTGRFLCERSEVKDQHALYHWDGMFYENLKRFPGALFDPHGYVIFRTENDYRASPYLSIGRKLNVPGGISSIPSYVRMQ